MHPKPQPDVAIKIYKAWVYENSTGNPLLIDCPDKRAKLLADGYSDCPTRAKSAPSKAEAEKIKAEEEAKAKLAKAEARELDEYRKGNSPKQSQATQRK